MEDFWNNVARYPRYLITIILGIFFALFGWTKPLLKNPITATALVGLVIGIFCLIYFTLRGMLGL